jgi:hypothetical protein
VTEQREEKHTSSANEFCADRGEVELADSFLAHRRPRLDPPRRAPPAKIPGRARANTPHNAYILGATTPIGDNSGRREEGQRGRGLGSACLFLGAVGHGPVALPLLIIRRGRRSSPRAAPAAGGGTLCSFELAQESCSS